MNNSSAQLHLQRMVHRRSQFPQAAQKWTAAGSFQSDVPGSSSVFQGCWCAAYLAMWSKVLILLSCLHVTSHVAHSIVPSQALFQAGLFFQLCLQTEAASRKRTENVKMEMRKTVASAQLKKCHGSENVDEGEALGAAAGCHFSNFYLETLQLSFFLALSITAALLWSSSSCYPYLQRWNLLQSHGLDMRSLSVTSTLPIGFNLPWLTSLVPTVVLLSEGAELLLFRRVSAVLSSIMLNEWRKIKDSFWW